MARQILIILLLATLTSCIQTKTRKPKSDLATQTQTVYKIDKRVQIDSMEIVKIDTTLNLFKGEFLIGIKVNGHIDKANNSVAIDYFKDLKFIETIDNHGREISINIVPTLRTTNPNLKKSKRTKTKVKYNYLADKTEFAFYVEKKVFTHGFGMYQINLTCGQRIETISLTRRK
jgi:hypothetical protein